MKRSETLITVFCIFNITGLSAYLLCIFCYHQVGAARKYMSLSVGDVQMFFGMASKDQFENRSA